MFLFFLMQEEIAGTGVSSHFDSSQLCDNTSMIDGKKTLSLWFEV